MRHESSVFFAAVGRVCRIGPGRSRRMRETRECSCGGRGAGAAVLRRGGADRSDTGPCRPDLPHDGLPEAISRRGAKDGRRARGQQGCGAQLWTRRKRLVAVVGGCRYRGEKGSRGCNGKPRRGGDRLRGAGFDGGDHGAANGAAGDDLCEGTAAVRAVVEGDGRVESGLAHRVDVGCGSGVRRPVGGDGADVVCHVSELPRPAGNSD
jgi:hypothetical protein